MNMKQLETFYWVERLGSFSAVAERMHATQSTISMRIQELEQSLGVKLFDRSHRLARLTPKGKELLPYVRQLVEITGEIQQRITPSDALSGVIKVGVVEIIASAWLPNFIREVQERYPKVSLELEIALSYDLIEKLRNGSLDVIFSAGKPPVGNYVCEPLGSMQLEWMASPTLGIPDAVISAQSLREWPFVTLNRNSIHHARIAAWMKQNELRPRRVIECNSMTVAATLVMAGVGVTLLPPATYRRELDEGVLRIVRTPLGMPPVEVFAMYGEDEFQPLAPLVTRFAVEVAGRLA
jgi:DNA-binding transcriptional LysR family regulator